MKGRPVKIPSEVLDFLLTWILQGKEIKISESSPLPEDVQIEFVQFDEAKQGLEFQLTSSEWPPVVVARKLFLEPRITTGTTTGTEPPCLILAAKD